MESSWQILKRLARKSVWSLLLGVVALLAVDFLQLSVPRVIKLAVDELTLGRADSRLLAIYGLIILGLAISTGLLRLLWRPLLFGFARRYERKLRQEIFDHMQTMHAGYLSELPPGEIMARATNDLNNIRMSVSFGLIAATDGVVMGLAAVGFMMFINPVLTIMALAPMPFIAYIGRVVGRRMHAGFMAVQESFAAITEQVREVLAAMGMVKVYALADREERRLAKAGRDYVDQNMRVAKLQSLMFPLASFFTSLSLAIVLGAGGPLAVFGQITPGDFVAFTAYLGLLTWPMMALGWVVGLLQRGRASMQRVTQIITAEPLINDPPNPQPLPQTHAGITVMNLHYTHQEAASPALDGVDLRAAQGQVTAVVGPVGCGKSTLLNLVPRIIDPSEGSIFVEDADVRTLRLADLRGHVVLAPQEAYLFSTSVRENLGLGRPDASDEELWQALEAAEFADEVRALPKGLDTELGERGHTLSGGQRQRLGLGRVLLLNPAVLLLDDPLSAVDTSTEQRILRNLAKLRAGKTTVIVSHRLASVAFASSIYVLDKGKVVEHGAHDDLVNKSGGLYQNLFAEQAAIAALED